MRPPISPVQLLLFTTILIALAIIIQVSLFRLALDKLGLAPHSAMILLFMTLFGSGINLPVARVVNKSADEEPVFPFSPGFLFGSRIEKGTTLIAVNVGGALIPVLFSFYLVIVSGLEILPIVLATLIITSISYLSSRPIKGLGIGMPVFIAPFSAVITSWFIAPEQSAPLAYICGTLGVLIGADLLRIKHIPYLNTPVASIGGAGTFDGIFLTGIVAVLLA